MAGRGLPRGRGFVLVAAAVLMLAQLAWGPAPVVRAQAEGGIIGTIVAERSFARLHGVRVVAVNRETGQSWETVSNSFGFYGLPVEPGIYDISFHHPDFLTHVEGPVAVRDNSAPSINPVLWDLDAEGSTALIGNLFWPNEWPAANYTVRVMTASGQLLDEALTDDLGSFSFNLGAGGLDLVLEFYNQDGNFDGSLPLKTEDRTARVLSTIAGGYRGYYEDRGPWF